MGSVQIISCDYWELDLGVAQLEDQEICPEARGAEYDHEIIEGGLGEDEEF